MVLHRSKLLAVTCFLVLRGSFTAQCDPTRLSPGDAAPFRGFGNAVAIEGDTAVVVAPVSPSSTDLGRAYVYRRSGSSWAEQQVLTASDGVTGDVFGWTVAISGHTIVVGTGAGKAYVFVEAGGHWSEQQILSVAGYDKLDLFGTFVALDGDTCVLTAPFDDYLGQWTGSAFVFVRSGSRWSLRQRGPLRFSGHRRRHDLHRGSRPRRRSRIRLRTRGRAVDATAGAHVRRRPRNNLRFLRLSDRL